MKRRSLLILASTSLPGLGSLVVHAPTEPEIFQWSGTALGADARLIMSGLTRDEASRAVTEVRNEVERLERTFSLYRQDSELSRLNREGYLNHPSQDFRFLLEATLDAWQQTGGSFNPAIQPLWEHLARHFASPSAGQPNEAALKHILALCSPQHIEVSATTINLAPGMALTFNGIAQGYITDAAARILESRGLRNILIDLGEFYALPGHPWEIRLPGNASRFTLANQALASSAGSGTPFSRDEKWHHILDPFTGHSPHRFASVTVTAASATMADMLSTALYVAPLERHAAILGRYPGTAVKTLTD